LTVLFVDVRGSTPLAESLGSDAFGRLMNRFYAVATDVLTTTDAFLDQLAGDAVMAVYLPLFAGQEPARQAVRAAEGLLRALGYGEASGPWLPAGVGVHTGPTYFGTISGAEGTLTDIHALGDTVNVAARLSSVARPGEALLSDATCAAAGLDAPQLEGRQLALKGKSEPISVRVFRAGIALPAHGP
jgi:adenylate cyclase